jgi:PAS domain-containing protein
MWTLVGLFAATGAPWLLRADEQSLAGPARAALAFLVAYHLVAAVADRLRTRLWLQAATALLQASLLGFLAVLWGWLGGLANPVLLVVFGVPIGAIGALLGRAPAVAAAGLSMVSVAAVALGSSSGLRWYASGAGLPAVETLGALGALTGADAGVATPPSEQFAAVASFAVLLLVWAFVSHAAGALVGRLVRWDRAGRSTSGLGLAGLAELREPAAIVLAETGVVAAVSRGFTERMLLHGEDAAGRELWELAAFDDLPALRRLVAEGGADDACRYSVGDEPRIARVEARRFDHGGLAYTWLRIGDRTEQWWLQAALAAASAAVLVVAADGRLRFGSTAARELLGEVHAGIEADVLLEPIGLGGGRWRSEAGFEQRMELAGRGYLASSTRLVVRGGEGSEAAWLVILRPETPA